MDSRIPKPSGLKKPTGETQNLFDFKTFRDKFSVPDQKQNNPLTEIGNKTLGSVSQSISTFRRARSPDYRSQPIAQPKLRRSKSAMDFRTEQPKGVKRFQQTLETIPSKRLRPTGTIAKASTAVRPTVVRPEKKAAILSTLKSNSSSNMMTTVPKKLPLTKSVSGGAVTTNSRLATTSAASKAPVQPKTAATKNIASKARPAPYDYKARHALLSEKFNDLKSRHEEQKEHLVSLEEQAGAAEERENELKAKLEAVEQDLFDATEEKVKLLTEINELKAANGELSMKNTALAETLSATSEELQELKVKHEKLEKVARDYEALTKKAAGMERQISETSNKLMMSQDQLYQINIERMVLHNMVLDLRGNIRVLARVRPPLNFEAEKSLCGWSFNDETSLEIISNEVVQSGARKQSKHEFSFDQVFNPHSTQDEIFEMVSPLIQSALDGYNVCIFAYGQTGSGKTYTMEGTSGNLGIIPRTVKLLFDSINTASIHGWSYTITASFLEIYNEVLYDLLSNDEKDIEIRMANPKNKTEIYVSNITEAVVTTDSMLYDLMRIASSNRATAATAGNDRSSRSHAVTRLQVVGCHPSRPESLIGFINLVDLAGSESGKTTTRMEETKNINRSLSELSNVILSLVQKQDHVPYRNSKLTHLLMPSLGGNSKTLMFVNVSPFQEHYNESVKSLRFAAQVNSCKLAKWKAHFEKRI